MMGSSGDIQDKVPGGADGVLPPIQPGMKKVESTAEIMNLTLHQVCKRAAASETLLFVYAKRKAQISCFCYIDSDFKPPALVCVRHGQKPRRQVLSQRGSNH